MGIEKRLEVVVESMDEKLRERDALGFDEGKRKEIAHEKDLRERIKRLGISASDIPIFSLGRNPGVRFLWYFEQRRPTFYEAVNLDRVYW